MKNFWSFLFVLCLITISIQKASAQSDTLFLYQAYHSFSDQEKAEWTAFENNWNYFDYSELKQKNKIKTLNCKNCASFYAEIFLEINPEGKISVIHFIKGKICGIKINNEQLIAQFENSLKKQTFTYLKNKKFTARFGHVLKC